MTRDETARLLAIVVAYWPQFPHQGEVTVNAWHELLAHVPYGLALEAVKLLATTQTFPPAVAELLDAIAELALPPDARMTPAEAWAMVLDAVRMTGVYGTPSLPGLVAEAVGVVGWREICTSENPDAVRAHFLRVYEQLQRRARRDVVLAPALRERLGVPAVPAPPTAIGAPRDETNSAAHWKE